MKKLLPLLFSLFFTFPCCAEMIISQVHSIEKGSPGKDHLIKFENGRAAFIHEEDKTTLKLFYDSFMKRQWIKVSIDEKNLLKELRPARPGFIFGEDPPTGGPEEEFPPFKPSVVSPDRALSIFNRMRRDYKQNSQCFNRAHIWTYDEYKKRNYSLNKVFLFFTSRYIRNYNYHWWFHVTPMVYVGGRNQSNWRMLDRRYTKGPLYSKTWTDIFIKTKRTCKVVEKYSEYNDNQYGRDCYLIPVSMYYVVPSDLEGIESEGQERKSFEETEIEYALWEAFR